MSHILIACEYSGRTREAFRRLGHDAWSCDLLPAEDGSPFHYQCDIFDMLPGGRYWQTMALEGQAPEWDLMIAHPDCTYVCSSGLHWNGRVPGREEKTLAAIAFAERLWNAGVYRIAIENPVGCLSTRSILGKPTQIIQPYQFGEDASKATCLWLKNLPPLRPTKFVEPRMINDRPRWGNQCDSGQNKLGPSADRWKERARTYAGWSDAFAQQWGSYIESYIEVRAT